MDKVMQLWYDKDKKGIEYYKHLIILDCTPEELDILKQGDDYVTEFQKKITKLNNTFDFQPLLTPEEDEQMMYNTDIKNAKEEGHTSGWKDGQLLLINNMLNNGMTMEEINKITSISLDEIKKIMG